MSRLSVTVIDVGWGDSILLDWNHGGARNFGLIDSNDTTYLRSSYIFLKRFFEREGVDTSAKPVFDFVVLSHGHSDHGQGLKAIMSEYGVRRFWYPKSAETGSMASLIRYARRSNNVQHHHAVDPTWNLPNFGDATMQVLWPLRNQISSDENNNSVVLSVTYRNVTFLLTGDAEEDVWQQIGASIPATTQVFKVPHHGSVNGTFDNAGGTPWLDHCPHAANLAISSHVRPFTHPDQEVIDRFDHLGLAYYRTDQHHHLTFCTTDGNAVNVRYSHV
ncbi:MAG: MBL fold metallo-hydrolase [Sedimentisphaerales bacterium]|nr:MBL fold metallo-hydrolase [Sedimentisphaerales bacterium]